MKVLSVIPGGTPSKYYFDGTPKAGISSREVSACLHETPAFAGVTAIYRVTVK